MITRCSIPHDREHSGAHSPENDAPWHSRSIDLHDGQGIFLFLLQRFEREDGSILLTVRTGEIELTDECSADADEHDCLIGLACRLAKVEEERLTQRLFTAHVLNAR